MEDLPEIRRENGVSTLYVDGRPFIAVGGELHNSSASGTAYMRGRVWPSLRGLHLNSVIATVSWEQVEPQEGVFDFTVVDELIADARQEGVRLTLIWFGLWKNGESNYAPRWVKQDPARFRICERAAADRIVFPYGDIGKYTISPLCAPAVEADAAAFRRLMRHLRACDPSHTVILIQVENETGLLGSARDFSPEADRLFDEPVPAAVAEAYHTGGRWKDAFGDDAEEAFMAWHYARALERIASAGRGEYPLPMYVNAWLEQYPDRAGAYPSGGPVAKMHRMWRLGAPALQFFAPDIYVRNFEDVAAEYSADGNPLFIPETQTAPCSAASVFLAVGKYNALGFHPFGIEDAFVPDPETQGFRDGGAGRYLARSFALVTGMTQTIARARGTGRMTGFYRQDAREGCVLSFPEYDIHIRYGETLPGRPPAGGLVIGAGPHEFLFAGVNFRAQFLPKKGEQKRVGFIRIEEGEWKSDEWLPGRILNGDEQRVEAGDEPQALRVELFKF